MNFRQWATRGGRRGTVTWRRGLLAYLIGACGQALLLALYVWVDAPFFAFWIASMVMWLALLWWVPTRP
jgi:hypothetical protein